MYPRYHRKEDTPTNRCKGILATSKWQASAIDDSLPSFDTKLIKISQRFGGWKMIRKSLLSRSILKHSRPSPVHDLIHKITIPSSKLSIPLGWNRWIAKIKQRSIVVGSHQESPGQLEFNRLTYFPCHPCKQSRPMAMANLWINTRLGATSGLMPKKIFRFTNPAMPAPAPALAFLSVSLPCLNLKSQDTNQRSIGSLSRIAYCTLLVTYWISIPLSVLPAGSCTVTVIPTVESWLRVKPSAAMLDLTKPFTHTRPVLWSKSCLYLQGAVQPKKNPGRCLRRWNC